MAAKKKRAMESPATTTQRLLRDGCSSAVLRRCAPHLRASLDHCQLSVWLGPQVATLSVLGSHLQHPAKRSHDTALDMHWLHMSATLSVLGSHLHHLAQRQSPYSHHTVLDMHWLDILFGP